MFCMGQPTPIPIAPQYAHPQSAATIAFFARSMWDSPSDPPAVGPKKIQEKDMQRNSGPISGTCTRRIAQHRPEQFGEFPPQKSNTCATATRSILLDLGDLRTAPEMVGHLTA